MTIHDETTMAYLEGLTYDLNSASLDETRQGCPVYNGSASGLTEWKYRIHVKKNTAMAAKPDKQRSRLRDLRQKSSMASTTER